MTPSYFILFPIIIILVTAVAIKLTVWPLFRRKQLRQQLLQTGREAEGIVLQVEQTGLYVNQLPELNIQLQVVPLRGQNFVTELKEIIPFTELAKIQPGLKLKLKYNPQNHKQVIILK